MKSFSLPPEKDIYKQLSRLNMHPSSFFRVLPLALFAAAIPHDIVPSKHQLSKRALPPLDIFPDDSTSQQHKNALSEALSDTLLLVQQVSLSYPGDDGSGPYADIWSKYFPPSDHKKVQGVWNKIMSDPKNPGQGEDIVRTAVIVGTDLVKLQLNVELCDGNTEAYTNPFPAGFDPGLPITATFSFFCDPAFNLPGRYGDITCAKVGDTLSSNMEFLGGTILHEWMHNDGIGAQGTGGAHIGDYSTPRTPRRLWALQDPPAPHQQPQPMHHKRRQLPLPRLRDHLHQVLPRWDQPLQRSCPRY